MDALLSDFTTTWNQLNLDKKLAELHRLQVETSRPDFWSDNKSAQTTSAHLARLSAELEPWLALQSTLSDLKELSDLNDPSLASELAAQVASAFATLANLKQSLRFTGKFDHNDAILRITSGVGGIEAMDWASILERMYLRFFASNHFRATLLDRTPGEEAGIKTAVYEISGQNTYGMLKSEHGVHRLVRLSPFNADNLRQTSFALVEVLPVITSDTEILIDPKDLRIDVYHSGGHGGQSVNTTNSAVRITHLPTGIVVAIQNERSQLQNKEKAMEILRAKLAQLKEEQQAESINQLRAGESAKWGQQIRNYVLQPYKLVKDTRTKHEETDADAVLDGNLMPFIDAYLASTL